MSQNPLVVTGNACAFGIDDLLSWGKQLGQSGAGDVGVVMSFCGMQYTSTEKPYIWFCENVSL